MNTEDRPFVNPALSVEVERVEIEKDGRTLFASRGYALNRALREGWTVVNNDVLHVSERGT